MSDEVLDISSLKKATASLRDAMQQQEDQYVRDAAIQRFEYTFELAWKMLKRYLKMKMGIEEHTIKDVFRESAKVGLIDDPEVWFAYLKARNLTTHTYNEMTAEETYVVAKDFLKDVEAMLVELEKGLARS